MSWISNTRLSTSSCTWLLPVAVSCHEEIKFSYRATRWVTEWASQRPLAVRMHCIRSSNLQSSICSVRPGTWSSQARRKVVWPLDAAVKWRPLVSRLNSLFFSTPCLFPSQCGRLRLSSASCYFEGTSSWPHLPVIVVESYPLESLLCHRSFVS